MKICSISLKIWYQASYVYNSRAARVASEAISFKKDRDFFELVVGAIRLLEVGSPRQLTILLCSIGERMPRALALISLSSNQQEVICCDAASGTSGRRNSKLPETRGNSSKENCTRAEDAKLKR